MRYLRDGDELGFTVETDFSAALAARGTTNTI
jgi:hypothetical protein